LRLSVLWLSFDHQATLLEESFDEYAANNESDEAQHQSMPASFANEVKATESQSCSQQKTASEKNSRLLGGRGPLYCPPQAGKEHQPDANAGKRSEREEDHDCSSGDSASSCMRRDCSDTHRHALAQPMQSPATSNANVHE
jgi:hypothetical protein